MSPYCHVLARFMNFVVVVTGPELSLEEHELLPLLPLEPDKEVEGIVEGLPSCLGDDEDCCRSSALSRTSLMSPRLVRGSRGAFEGVVGGGGSRKTESSSVSTEGQRDRGSRGRDPMEDTDLRLPDAFSGEQGSQARGDTSSPPPNTSPKSTKLWQSNSICRFAFCNAACRLRKRSLVS